MWNVEVKVKPILIGATRSLSQSFQKHADGIPDKHSIVELQRTETLGTTHTPRKILK
jgi:hypothetical protein